MSNVIANAFNVPAGSDIYVLLRLLNVDQTVMDQASISTVTRKITNTTTNSVTGPTTLSVDSVIFSTPQTDYGWEFATSGYNFRDTFNMSAAGSILVTYTFVDVTSKTTVIVVSGTVTGTP